MAALFRIGLSTFITKEQLVAIIICAVVYAGLMLINGGYFGRKEYYEDLPIYDVGFRFHLFTFLAHNVVSVLWFVGDFQSRYESFSNILVTALIWSVVLIIHFIYFRSQRNVTIRGLDSEDMFE